jgi:molybdate transport system substrate-binding protein
MLLVAVLGGCDSPSAPHAPANDTAAGEAPREVRVAAAADLRFALEDAIHAFETANPDIHVTATFGSSGNFFQQLSNKAPFDLFLSADIGYPEKLIEQELALPDTLFEYATGKIVVWARKDSPLKVDFDGIDVLRNSDAKKIAIANPKFAPYGRAAEAALKSLNLYDEVEPRLVLGENIAQTAQFVESGSADVGIIALSIALAPAMRDQGQFALVPTDAYLPIRQGGVVLSWVQDREATLKFREFLESARGRAVLEHFGFSGTGK